jgi:hypothetical protein
MNQRPALAVSVKTSMAHHLAVFLVALTGALGACTTSNNPDAGTSTAGSTSAGTSSSGTGGSTGAGTGTSTGTGSGTSTGTSTGTGTGSGTSTGTSTGTGSGSGTTGGAAIGTLAMATIGSTVDAMNGDQNPYGLAIAPVTSGSLTQGDLLVCNFSDSANVEGNGTTIEVLHPTPGSTPTRLVQDANVKGCAALAMGSAGDPWATGNTANLAPFYSSAGVLISTLSQETWHSPWGEAFSPTDGAFGAAAFYVSNSGDGSIVRVNISSGGVFTFDPIATGFSVNGGVPGSILGPAGLTYDAAHDTLFIVDSNQNRVVAFAAVSAIPAAGIQVAGAGTFAGPSAASATVIYSGAPLNDPISSAQIFNGDLIVGNTGDNLLIEISPAAKAFVGSQNLDTGPSGALFGIAASGTSLSTLKIYFNDDNDNTVRVLSASGAIGSLTTTTIGSTVDPTNGDQNPYGLAIAPVTAGSLTQGDLLVCNFSDSANVEGNGTTIEVLHPTHGSTPTRLVQDANVKGCAALAMGSAGDPWATGNTANLAPFYSSSGALISTLSQETWHSPWGEAFSPTDGAFGAAAFYVSNSGDGSIVRVNISSGGAFTFDAIATGFSVNGGVPGSILGPAGLTYDAAHDTLFIVDSNQNRVVAFAAVSAIPAAGIQVQSAGTFAGPSAASATVVYTGVPLNDPISAALLFNGNLVVGNTGDNQLIEISPAGIVVGTQTLDTGAVGALFGIAASGTNLSTLKIYFNDDNDNTVKVLTQ